MKILFSILLTLFTFYLFSAENPNVILPEGTYPYWPTYNYIEDANVANIQAQEWKITDNQIEGWDWSLPAFVQPSPRSSVGLQRNMGWDKDFMQFNLQFKANPVGLLWVKWRDIEKTKDNFDFAPLINRIKQAQSVGTQISLRILCHSKSRGTSTGEAPLWLEDLGVTFLPQENLGDNLNFNPAHPVFHQRYLKLITELAKTEIPSLVKAAYVGYASHALGDEGIGPYGETNSAANDTVEHVRERLDAWENAFKGMETKVYMGGSCDYGFKKGFGTRRGFVEMYLYRIPNIDMGQYIDNNGYLNVDETAPIIKYKGIHGEVNEEYESAWATDGRSFRFGNTTNSFPYRYFTSNLRALQMQCTYVHTTGHLLPQMLPFLSLELGRTVEDAPDVWSFLRTSYLNANTYKNRDWKNRPITTLEQSEGIETKNFERWLYQRDAIGYETLPEEKIQQAIKMSGVQSTKYYDFIARSAKKIGFDIDSRWPGSNQQIAIKVTYFDRKAGSLNLVYKNGTESLQKSQTLLGDNKLKTVTFFIPKITLDGLPNNFDFALEAGATTEKIVVSMVRVIQAVEVLNNTGTINERKPISISYLSVQNILLINSEAELKVLTIFDNTGKTIKQINISGNYFEMPIKRISKGIYIVQAQDKIGNLKKVKIQF